MKTPAHRFSRPFAVLAVFLCGFATATLAQTASDTPALGEKKPVAYRLCATDKISIGFAGDPDLNVAGKRIDVNGNVNLMYVPDVHLAGLTVPQAQTAIENAYKDARILRKPEVTINIEEYAPRLVSVGGLVKFPGTINLPPETVMTLKDLLNKVQLAETANAKAVRISRVLPDGTTTVITKNVDGILRAKATDTSADGDFVIEPGDTVIVPEKIF